MAKFEESKHPRDKEGKFTTKGNEGGKEYRQNTSYNEIIKKQKLEDKYNSELPIFLPDEQLPFSVGAKWINKDILMPNGKYAHFVEGSKIINKQVFAGKGTKTPIRDIERLVEQYPNTKAENWQKVKGTAELDLDGETFKAEIHWYEEPSVGKVEIKYKKLD